PVRPGPGHLPRLLRAAGRRAGATDRRIEKWFTHGSVVLSSLSGQRAEAAGAYASVRLGRVVPGSDGGAPGGSPGGSEHVAAALVESRRARPDQCAADLVPFLDALAQPRAVRAGVPGGAAVRAASAGGGGGLAECQFLAALITLPKIRKAAGRWPVKIPC